MTLIYCPECQDVFNAAKRSTCTCGKSSGKHGAKIAVSGEAVPIIFDAMSLAKAVNGWRKSEGAIQTSLFAYLPGKNKVERG